MNKIIKFFTLLMFMVSSVNSDAAKYFLTSGGANNAELVGSWNTIAAGGGTAATNFTTANDTFTINAGTNATFSANTTFGAGVTLQILGSGLAKIAKSATAVTLTINGTLCCEGTANNNVSGVAAGTLVMGNGSTLCTKNTTGVVSSATSNTASINTKFITFTPNTASNYMFLGNGVQSILGMPATVADLIIGPTASISFSANQTVTGTLFVESDVTGTGSIGNSTGTITGTVKVERYIPANRKYRFLSSPVVGGTAAQWRNSGTNTSGVGIQITGKGTNFDPSGSNNPSAFSYNETLSGSSTTVGSGSTNDPGWTAFLDGNTTLTNGAGYRVMVRGDRSINLFLSNQTATPTTISVSGTYPIMPRTINVTKTGTNTNSGFNLVGNPVPSSISWNAITKTNVGGTYYTYNPTLGYVSWNGTVGSAGDLISSSQAFFVVATAATGSISISEASKNTGAGGAFFKKSIYNCLTLKLQYVYPDSVIPSPDLECSQYIHLREDASDTFEMDKDGFHLMNPGINFYSLDTNNVKYSINCLSIGDKNVKLGLSNTVLANYKLLISGFSSFSDMSIYLKDSLTGNIYEITNDTFSVNVNHDSQSSLIADNRFVILLRKKVTTVIDEIYLNNSITLYPNPTQNIINIKMSNPTSELYSYDIYNLYGSKMLSGTLDYSNNDIQSISTGELICGSYVLHLSNSASNKILFFNK